jgi:hypothetical protein
MQRADVRIGLRVRDRWWPEVTGQIIGTSPRVRRVTVRWNNGKEWNYDLGHLGFLEPLAKRS